MEAKNHGMRYRQSSYRRKRLRTFLILAAVLLMVLITLLLILGNLFSQKMNEDDESTNPPTSSDTLPPLPADKVRQISSVALDLSEGAAKSKNALSALSEQGASAVSFYMNDPKDPKGTLFYRSIVASSLNSAMVGEYSLNLSEFSDLAEGYGIYLSGAFCPKIDYDDDELIRWARLSEAAVLIAEALRDGMDDVVIVTPDLPVEQYGDMLRLADEIRALSPDAVIGFSLPNAFLTQPDAKIIDELAMKFDYLACDLSQYGSDDPVTFAQERVGSMLYYLLRYKMRVLIPTLSDTAAQDALQKVLDENSITNRMRLP